MPLSALQGVPGLAPYGNRNDGTGAKGGGYFGTLNNSTELSAGFDIDGKEVEVPLLVPTLTQDEINSVLNGKPTSAIYEKAYQHAVSRMRGGQSAYIGRELRATPGMLEGVQGAR